MSLHELPGAHNYKFRFYFQKMFLISIILLELLEDKFLVPKTYLENFNPINFTEEITLRLVNIDLNFDNHKD